MRSLARLLFAARPSVRRPLQHKCRPVLEALESRYAPSVSVLTYHDNAASTGLNAAETALTASNVNSASFGKVFSSGVDGQVYAQPLVMAGVNITTGAEPGVHDVVFVATEHDSLYAFDASTGNLLWHDALLPSKYQGTVTSVPSADVGTNDLSPEIGITSTPVIDPSTGTLYLEEKTKEVISGNTHYMHWLQAISVSNGAARFGGPVVIADSIGDTYVSGPIVNGNGNSAHGLPSGEVGFDALRQMNRAALSLVNGTLYLGYASHGDNQPYNGWVLGYSAATLHLTGVFCSTPNGTEGGIWQGGGRIAADAGGFLYVETGNGTFDTTLNAQGFPSSGDYGDSFVKLAVDPTTTAMHQNINGWGLKAVDYFTPQNQDMLNSGDLDLGSGGPLLLPASAGSAAHPQLLVGSGKQGAIYLIDCRNMGHFHSSTDNIVQELPAGTLSGSFDTASYFNGQIYYGGPGDSLKAFSIHNAQLSLSPTSQSSGSFDFPGDTLSISANGFKNGIVWALERGSNELRAYDAGNLANALYTSDQAANQRDQLGATIKFAVPTEANGHVYVGTDGALVAYALLPDVLATVKGTTLFLTKAAPGNTTLTITHSASFQGLTVTAGGATVLNSGQTSFTTPGPITNLVVSLGAGDDSLTIDGTASGAITLPAGLTITGTSANKTITVLNTRVLSGNLTVSLTGNGAETCTFTDVSVGGAGSISHPGVGATSVTINASGNAKALNRWGSLSIKDGTGADTNAISDTDFSGNVTINNGPGDNSPASDTGTHAGSFTKISAGVEQALGTIGGSLVVSTLSGQSDTQLNDYNVVLSVTIGTGAGIKNQSAGSFVGIENAATVTGTAGMPSIGGSVTINGTAVAGLAPGLLIDLGTANPFTIGGRLTHNAVGTGSASITLQDLRVLGATAITLGSQTHGDTLSVQGATTTALFNAFSVVSLATGANTFTIQDQAGKTDFAGAVSYQLGAGNDTLNLAADAANPTGLPGAVVDFFTTASFDGGTGTNTLFQGTANTNLFFITRPKFIRF
jgi:hypothetical protein